MYKSGDLTKNIDKLKSELKLIKYPEKVLDSMLLEGNPIAYLPILHYCFLSYSPHIAQYLLDNDYELFSKNDKEFFDKIYNATIYLFNFKPTLSATQFFKLGLYAEAKVIFCLEIIRIVKQFHNNLIKKTYKTKQNRLKRDDVADKRIKVINHRQEEYEDEEPQHYNYEDRMMSSPKFNEGIVNYDKMNNEFKEDSEYNGYNGYKEYDQGSEENEAYNMKQASFGEDEYKKQIVDKPEINKEKNDFSSVIDIINNLACSVKEMTGRIEVFKNNIEGRVSKLEADMTLIKNRLILLEDKKVKTSYEKNIINTSVNDEHLFSFAIDEDKFKQEPKPQANERENNFSQMSTSSTNHAKKPSDHRALNFVKDTDSLIERVTNHFRETRKLLDFDNKI
jgi:centrosomal protein CEP44